MKLRSIIIIILILILAAAAYWYFFVRKGTTTTGGINTGIGSIFTPFGRNPSNSGGTRTDPTPIGSSTSTPRGTATTQIPALRLLSDTPVGGYGASTTGRVGGPQASSTTIVRWVDRGRGNVYEARGNTLDIVTLSNTVVPRIAESLWNRNLSSFVAQSFSADGSAVEGIYAELRARALAKSATSTTSLTPFELRGKSLPSNVLAYAVSPRRDRVFLLLKQNGLGVGYTMAFDGSSSVQIFTTPLTQVNVEWPEEQTLAITTKGAADERGYLYFVNPRSGIWKRILGPLPGLSTKVSTDAKRVFISAAGNSNDIVTSIYNIAENKGTDAVIRTLADKCVWGNFYKELVYCGVPAEQVLATYPDDWYKGYASFIDKIWKLNVVTGEINLVSSIVDTSDRVIDAFNLGLDDRDHYLIFMNKNDLSLWSLDLIKAD